LSVGFVAAVNHEDSDQDDDTKGTKPRTQWGIGIKQPCLGRAAPDRQVIRNASDVPFSGRVRALLHMRNLGPVVKRRSMGIRRAGQRDRPDQRVTVGGDYRLAVAMRRFVASES